MRSRVVVACGSALWAACSGEAASTGSASQQADAGSLAGAPSHTELGDGNVLVLRAGVPIDAAACAARGPRESCNDADEDGLTDRWEDVAIDRLRPFVMLDEEERLLGDAGARTGIVARVAPVGAFIEVHLMLGYSSDYGSCGVSAHAGDSERVALRLERMPGGDAGDAKVVGAYTAAHEGSPRDHSRTFTGDDLRLLTMEDDPATGEPRWAVYASANKHATYASVTICESISRVPCLEEDCGPDGVEDAARFRLLMPYVNAGEAAKPMVTDLASVGFPGEQAWADRRFCGGRGGSDCASPVREKLLPSMFSTEGR